MGNDGVDMIASDVVIRGNLIRSGRHTPAEPLHPDGIQGWTSKGSTNRNVVVDSNKIINLNPAEDNYLQGISIFDGKWDGLTVTNNLVITNFWNGITLFGVANALVINNTVIATRPDKRPTWLSIAPAKDKTPSQHVRRAQQYGDASACRQRGFDIRSQLGRKAHFVPRRRRGPGQDRQGRRRRQ